MTHVEQGNYRGKHPEDKAADPRIAPALRSVEKNRRISCAAATRVAEELSVTLAEVGVTADLLELKIDRCQLGLFGYGPYKNKHSILEPPETVAPELEETIRARLDGDRLTCEAAWAIAEENGLSKRAVCEAADALGIKSSQCQLGVF